MTIVFRADASARVGTGHVMRCLVLAEALRERGAQVRFVCREHPGHLIAVLRQRSLPVAVLPAPSAPAGEADGRAPWYGVSQIDDADQTIDALSGDAPDWIVADHYGLGVEWETRVRARTGRLLVIDDLANRAHCCDLLLDQNYSDASARRHAGLLPEHCELLAGPRYALLAPEYERQRRTQPPRDGRVRRILVYFGGVDPANMSAQALTALSAPSLRHLAVDLIIGTNHSHRQALDAQAAARPGTSVHGTRPHLADLMVRADLSVGAGGVTTWERMCLGLPSVVVSIAENQRPTNEALAAAGLIEYLGDSGSAGAVQIREAVERLLEDPDRLADLSSRGQMLVDGQGAARVAGRLLEAPDPLRIRQALHDADARPEGFDTFAFAWIDRCRADDVLALRNRPHVTAQMRSRAAIAAADHRRFIDGYDRLERYDFVLIDTLRNRYVGVFYVTNLASAPELGKYIGDADYLGKGIARRATEQLAAFCRARAGVRRLTAITRRDNARNIALNASLGFRQTGTQGEYAIMVLDL